jgi:radical SAM superfamily enzyme YgiQ (UPF0313 family)
MKEKSYGRKTWKNVEFEDPFPDRKRKRIIGMTFPPAMKNLALEPAILTVLPPGKNVEFDPSNRDYNDADVKLYVCSVYIAGLDQFIEWANRHDRKKIVVGGYHPTTFPEDFERYAAKIVLGPCDDLLATVAQKGQIVRGIVSNKTLPRRDLYDIKSNWQIIPDMKPGQIAVSINTSSGCNIMPPCDFCCTHMMSERLTSRPLEMVKKEARSLRQYKPDFLFIRDENFTMQNDWRTRLEAINQALPEAKIYLFASANTLNEKAAAFIAEHGTYMVCLGLEDPTKEYAKNRNLDRTVALLKENGIMAYLSFIVDPLKVIGREQGQEFYSLLMNRLYELGPEMICGNFLMPFRGTKIWDQYYALVSREDYRHYNTKEPFLIRNEILKEKMKFFLFWYQWLYFNSEFYNTQVRQFAVKDTLHLRFLDLYDEFVPRYERLWNVRP